LEKGRVWAERRRGAGGVVEVVEKEKEEERTIGSYMEGAVAKGWWGRGGVEIVYLRIAGVYACEIACKHAHAHMHRCLCVHTHAHT